MQGRQEETGNDAFSSAELAVLLNFRSVSQNVKFSRLGFKVSLAEWLGDGGGDTKGQERRIGLACLQAISRGKWKGERNFGEASGPDSTTRRRLTCKAEKSSRVMYTRVGKRNAHSSNLNFCPHGA